MKASKQQIDEFVSEKSFLFYGISSVKGKFGNLVLKHLNDNGYKVIPIHPELKQINGIDCFVKPADVNQQMTSAIIILSPENTEKVVEELIDYGIKKLWIQQRSESDKAVKMCEEKGVEVITGECIMMFTEPITVVHNIHKWINKIIGRYPVLEKMDT
jgi:predicted CoA-binding protein